MLSRHSREPPTRSLASVHVSTCSFRSKRQNLVHVEVEVASEK
jgi:hypothetical protein